MESSRSNPFFDFKKPLIMCLGILTLCAFLFTASIDLELVKLD